MPQAVVAIASAAAAKGAAALATSVAASASASTFATAVITTVAATVASVGVSAIGQKIFGKKKKSQDLPLVDRMIRQPITSRKVVYGKRRVSGPMSFIDVTQNNSSLNIIISLAGHEIESIENVYVDIPENYLNSDGSITTTGTNPASDSLSLFQYWEQLGGASQTAISSLVSESSNWTSNHRGRGVAYAYCKLKWNGDFYPGGIPNVSFEIKGAKLYDTRTTTTAYSNNPALILYDYLTNTDYGLGAATTEIDTDSFDTAANVCEEAVTLKAGGTHDRYACDIVLDTAVPPGENIEKILATMGGLLVYSNGTFKVFAGEYRTPTITLTESDLRGPIKITPRLSKSDIFNSVRGQFVSELDAYQPTDFPVVTNSTYVTEDSNETIWLDMQLDGVVNSARAQRLAKAQLERVRQQIQVTLPCKMSAFELDVGDTVQVTNTRMGWSAKPFEIEAWTFNTSNGELGVDLTLRETASTIYDWTESTEETTVDAAPNSNLPNAFVTTVPTGLALDSGTDHLILSADGTVISRLKVTWDDIDDLYVSENGEIEIDFKKTTDTAWQRWNKVDGSATFAYIVPVEDGISYDVRLRAKNSIGRKSTYTSTVSHTIVGKTEPPTNVSVFYALQVSDAIGFSWNEVTDKDLSGYEIRYGIQGTTTWDDATPISKVTKGTHSANLNVPPGTWTFLIKSVDTTGNYSNRSAAYNLTVDNNNNILEYQEDENFALGTLSNFILHHTGVLECDSITLASDNTIDIFDHSAVTMQGTCTYTSPEIDLGTSTTVRVWSLIEGGLLPNVTTGFFQPRFQIFHRKSTDPSGLFEDEVNQLKSPTTATLTNCVLHHTGVIVPDSQNLASADDFETFDEFVTNPYDECEYELAEIDMASDRNVTIDFDLISSNGPGETGHLPATIEIDYRIAAGSYDGFEEITGPTPINARYIKIKVKMNTTGGVQKVTEFDTKIDPFIDWQLGAFTGRYVTVRAIMDTVNEGKGKITRIQVTGDR